VFAMVVQVIEGGNAVDNRSRAEEPYDLLETIVSRLRRLKVRDALDQEQGRKDWSAANGLSLHARSANAVAGSCD
jgi:hypothetical protein